MKTKTSLTVLAGSVFGLIHGIFWRFQSILFIDNFYSDFILSWVVPLIIGIIIFVIDKNTINKKVLNSVLFWLLAVIIYFIIIFPTYVF